MKQKSVIIAVAMFIVGGVVGGLVFTRHYGVGPLAKLQSQASHAGSPCGSDYFIGSQYGPAGSSTMYNMCVDENGSPYSEESRIRGMVSDSQAGHWYFISSLPGNAPNVPALLQ